MTCSECISDSLKQANEQPVSARREEGALWSQWMGVCNSSKRRFSSWTTFLSPYLRLVPLTNTFLCCFWQLVALHTLPRLCRLNNTLLPVWPLEPQGTTTHTDRNEGNGLWFPSTFHTSNGEGVRTVFWPWLSWIDKLACVFQCPLNCMCVFFCVCWIQYNACVLRNRWVHFFLPLLYMSVDIVRKVNIS